MRYDPCAVGFIGSVGVWSVVLQITPHFLCLCLQDNLRRHLQHVNFDHVVCKGRTQELPPPPFFGGLAFTFSCIVSWMAAA